MANIAPYGRDLTSGIIRAFTSSDSLTDEDGAALIASTKLAPTPIVFNAGLRATVGPGASVAISASPLTVPASTFTSFMILDYACTFQANHGAGGPHILTAEVTINGSTLAAIGGQESPQEGPSSYSVGFFVSGFRAGGSFIFHGGNGFNPAAVTTCDWGLFINPDGGSGTMRLHDCYMAVVGV